MITPWLSSAASTRRSGEQRTPRTVSPRPRRFSTSATYLKPTSRSSISGESPASCGDAAEDLGGDERLDHEAAPARALRDRASGSSRAARRSGCRRSGTRSRPRAATSSADAVGVRVARQHDLRAVLVREGAGRRGRLRHLRVRRAERDRGEAAVGALVVGARCTGKPSASSTRPTVSSPQPHSGV